MTEKIIRAFDKWNRIKVESQLKSGFLTREEVIVRLDRAQEPKFELSLSTKIDSFSKGMPGVWKALVGHHFEPNQSFNECGWAGNEGMLLVCLLKDIFADCKPSFLVQQSDMVTLNVHINDKKVNILVLDTENHAGGFSSPGGGIVFYVVKDRGDNQSSYIKAADMISQYLIDRLDAISSARESAGSQPIKPDISQIQITQKELLTEDMESEGASYHSDSIPRPRP